MITTEELKVKLAEYGTAVKDLEEALAIEASRKREEESNTQWCEMPSWGKPLPIYNR